MRKLIVNFCMIPLLFWAHAATAEKRVAFIAGNGTYKNVKPLSNPPIDASLMADALRRVGFDIVAGYNLSREKMVERLAYFAKQSQGADIALFYYSGYAISIEGVNYLLPVDANPLSAEDIKLGAGFNIDTELRQAMGEAKVRLVFLDASYNNPFSSKFGALRLTRSKSESQGLAEMRTGDGTFIAFATSPGAAALHGKDRTNSPFTRALIANITKPDVEINQVMKSVRAQVNEETNKQQLPWNTSGLIGEVYLNPILTRGPTSTSPPAPSQTGQPLVPNEPSLPDFPRPIPAASASYVLPDNLLRNYSTLKDATDGIISALERSGYVERTFFRTESGIALVTRLERIEADGRPFIERDRWAIGEQNYKSTYDLAQFLYRLFFVEEGRYRLIIFILQDAPFIQSGQKFSGSEARGLMARGANILPAGAGKQPFAGYYCTVLIYEFASDGKAVNLVDSRLTGKQHLDKAGVLSLLGR